jgi:hypothetical protein
VAATPHAPEPSSNPKLGRLHTQVMSRPEALLGFDGTAHLHAVNRAVTQESNVKLANKQIEAGIVTSARMLIKAASVDALL